MVPLWDHFGVRCSMSRANDSFIHSFIRISQGPQLRSLSRQKDYVQWGCAWFPKGISYDTAITSPVPCSLQHSTFYLGFSRLEARYPGCVVVMLYRCPLPTSTHYIGGCVGNWSSLDTVDRRSLGNAADTWWFMINIKIWKIVLIAVWKCFHLYHVSQAVMWWVLFRHLSKINLLYLIFWWTIQFLYNLRIKLLAEWLGYYCLQIVSKQLQRLLDVWHMDGIKQKTTQSLVLVLSPS